MKMKPFGAWVLMLVIFFPIVSSSADIDPNVKALLDGSGITKQTGEYPGLWKMSLMQAKQEGVKFRGDVFQAAMGSIDQSVRPDHIVEEIGKNLSGKLSDAEIKELLTWFQSEIGKKVTKAEEEASTPEAYLDMQKTAESLLKNQKLVSYAQEIDNILKVSDLTVDLQNSVQRTVVGTLLRSLNPDQKVDKEQLETIIKQNEKSFRENVSSTVIVSLVYAYRNLKDNEIERYLEFLRTPVNRKFSQIAAETTIKEINASTELIAESIAKALHSDRGA